MEENTKVTLEYVLANRPKLLAELNEQQGVLRDLIRSVPLQYATGCYVYGRSGTAKTHTVRSVLDEIGDPWTYQCGHLTPLGLFDLIKAHASDVIVLDDLPLIFKSDVVRQILLAALEHPTATDRSRLVKYRRQRGEQLAQFRGGIICISNRELHSDVVLDAFKSRVHTFRYNPTDGQLAAMMLQIADDGWSADSCKLSPEDARKVAHSLIGELTRLSCPFDLRLLVNKSFPLFQQWKDGETDCHWQALVTAAIEQHMSGGPNAHDAPLPSKEARLAKQRVIAREICRDFPSRKERLQASTERTGGASERAFDRRVAEIQER